MKDVYSYYLGDRSRYQLRKGISPFNSDILRFGDVDKDGFDDLLVTLEDKDSRKKHAFLFKSEECDEDLAKDLGVEKEICRFFNLKPFEEDSKYLREANSFMTTFFDFGEFG